MNLNAAIDLECLDLHALREIADGLESSPGAVDWDYAEDAVVEALIGTGAIARLAGAVALGRKPTLTPGQRAAVLRALINSSSSDDVEVRAVPHPAYYPPGRVPDGPDGYVVRGITLEGVEIPACLLTEKGLQEVAGLYGKPWPGLAQ
jgi:hypothetical protein